MLPIKQRLDNNDHYDGGNNIQYIVIHDTGNTTDSDEGNANYFCTGARGASAHYFVDDDSITQVVLDSDCSWHCGDGHNAYGIGNRNSLGIEQCRVNGVVTATTEANTIELVKFLMAKYNVPVDRVVRHYDASRKNCPASFNLDGKWTRWFEFKSRLVAPVVSAPTPSGEIYRVRKDWNDIRSQIEADTILDNAKKCVDAHAGYKAFNSKGEVVYPLAQQPVSQPTPQPQSQPVKSIDSKTLSLQKALNRLGFKGSNGNRLAEDGDYGTNTTFAVKSFQSMAGLKVDGIAGNNTWDAINSILDKPLCKRGSTGVAVRYIQYRVGASVDGSFGSKTNSSVIVWQKRNGLAIDGMVGQNTWRKLIG